ncbi:MAG: CehA/McbA family metallohydrolase [Candidatus Aminicenantaceae bacterium]
MKRYGAVLCIGLFLAASPGLSQEPQWYKGNTHCHTLHSDGDEFPRRVIRWYRDHEYNFIVITDHNTITEVKYLDTDDRDDFILIQGEEVSDSFKGTPVHLNALDTQKLIEPQHGASIVETLQNNVDAVRRAGAVPQINHPNWKWSFTHEEMSQLTGVYLFELYNICYDCNNFGAGGRPGMEEIWDKILSKGVLMYGVASDDAHDYLGEFSQFKSNPGTGWIMVRADKLTPGAIVTALEKGDFYATVGVTLKDIRVSKNKYVVEIEPYRDLTYTTCFTGRDGRILQETHGNRAEYRFTGDELYVRARVFESSGKFACTQPVFVKK